MEQKKGIETTKWDEVNGSVSGEILEAFFNAHEDSFAILQLKESDEMRGIQFMSYDFVTRQGHNPEINFYDAVYAGSIITTDRKTDFVLENLFERFNIGRPEDFTGHSLSVSDVIALKRQNEIKYYYVDSFGFQELPGFNSSKNQLRSLEDMIEQNDNQLDGIINNLPTETVAEKEAKSSIVEKLKSMIIDLHDKDERKPIPCPGRELC